MDFVVYFIEISVILMRVT